MSYSYLSYLKYVLALAGGSLAYVFYHHLNLSIPRNGEAPIRWSWLPFLGWAIELGKRPIDFMQECAGIYDDIFGIVVGGNRMFIICDALSTTVVTKPVKDLSLEEFQESVMKLFFGMSKDMFENKAMDGDVLRRQFSTYLLR